MSTTGNDKTSEQHNTSDSHPPTPNTSTSPPTTNSPDEPHISINPDGTWKLNLPPQPQNSYSIPTTAIQNIIDTHNNHLNTIKQQQHTINTLIVTGNVLTQQLAQHDNTPLDTIAIQGWQQIIQ